MVQVMVHPEKTQLISAMAMIGTRGIGFSLLTVILFLLGDCTARIRFPPRRLPLSVSTLSIGKAIPIRYAGVHLCYDDPTLHNTVGFIILVTSAFTNARVFDHCGKYLVTRIALN